MTDQGDEPRGVTASVEHLDFPVDPQLVRAFERRALALVLRDADMPHSARSRLFQFDSIERLCEQTPVELLTIWNVGPISLRRLEHVLAQRGLYLCGEAP